MTPQNEILYRDMPFSTETPQGEFYTFIDISYIPEYCEDCMGGVIKCRTIGILSSDLGKYYLNHINQPDDVTRIRLSMLYLEEPPTSTVIPYPVQVFGELQRKNKPVIFARVIQHMTAGMAIRMNRFLNDVWTLHSANNMPIIQP